MRPSQSVNCNNQNDHHDQQINLLIKPRQPVWKINIKIIFFRIRIFAGYNCQRAKAFKY